MRPICFFVLAITILSGSLAPALSDEVNDPWAPLGLIQIKSKFGTIFLDPALGQKRDEIKSAIESVLSAHKASVRSLRFVLRRKQEILDVANEILGCAPNKKQSAMQENVLEFFSTTPLLNLAQPGELGLYVLLKPKTKEYLKNGAQLPGFSYDPKTDKASAHLIVKKSGPLNNPNRGEEEAQVKTLPFPVKSADTAVEDILEQQSVFTDISPLQAAMAIHEMVELTIHLEMQRPTDPLYRWFSDGFANAITLEILSRLDQDNALEEMKTMYDIAKYTDIRQEVNLRYWPMAPSSIVSPVEVEKRLCAARYSFATYEASRLIEKHGVGIVQKIMSSVSSDSRERSHDLIETVSEVTGEDISARLRRYQKFDTVRDGLKLYGAASKKADLNKDHKQKFINLCRFTELGLSTGFDHRAYIFIANTLHEMGHTEAGATIFKNWIKNTEGGNTSAFVDIWRRAFMLYAFSCDNISMVYTVAEEYRRTHPDYGVAALVRAHELKSLGRVNEAKALAKRLRPGVETIEGTHQKSFLRVLDRIETTEEESNK